MSFRQFAIVSALFSCLTGVVFAQPVADLTIVSLTVDSGFPLQVRLTDKVQFKKNGSVHAVISEAVYAFDREVIPSGTAVEGNITGFRKPGKWKRVSLMLRGDFTPPREPEITFHTLVFPDGTRMSIETSVTTGMEKVGAQDDVKKSVMSTIKPEKRRLNNMLWGLSPYRPQSLPPGTALTATLLTPIDFGDALLADGALDDLGVEPPAGSTLFARLVTPLDSRKTPAGAPFEAILTRPLFSPEQRLIFPVGARLWGTVSEAKPARSFHRHGELALNLTTITPPESLMAGTLPPQEVDGGLVRVEVDEGSKKRLIGMAWSIVKAQRSLGATADPFGQALLGTYRGKFLKQITGGDGGLGLPASISGAMFPPVGIGLGVYGAARSIYVNLLGRGQDVRLPANTPIEIRLQ
jgi:hypothetical protein